jgi:hypothetical protein
MYLYSKNLILINFFTVKVPDMMSLGEFWYKKNKGKLICNSPNDIISRNFDSEKVGQDGIFYYKDIITFLLRMTQILHIPNTIFGVSRTLRFQAVS